MSKQKYSQLDPIESKWFAVYVKVNTEKHIARNLSKKGIECYVPVIDVIKRYKTKVRRTKKPLISCYIFVKITSSEYVKVLQTEYVICFLKMNKNLIAIPEEEIATLRWVVGEKFAFRIEEGVLQKGTAVEVISGNLTGLKGKIVKKASKKSFYVNLDMMGYKLGIDIPKECLAIIKNRQVA